MQEPHYECPITGDVLPEEDMRDIIVYKMQTDGYDHFQHERKESVKVSGGLFGSTVKNVELLTAFGELIAVYREDATYGRAYSPDSDRVSDERVDLYEEIVDMVFHNY